MEDTTTGIIILAAGASTRMGEPKQLLRIGTERLLQRVVRLALETPFRPVVVVLGANRELIEPTLKDMGTIIVFNPDWATGMGSSIASGLAHLLQYEPEIQQVLILVGDQPLLSTAVLMKLVELKREQAKPLVVSAYADTLGVPALFDRVLFPELQALHGAPGAKGLIQKYAVQAAILEFNEGALDIDTPAEWAAFLTKINADQA